SYSRQHRLYNRGSVLYAQRENRTLRFALATEADGQQGYPQGSPLGNGRHANSLRFLQGIAGEEINGLPDDRMGPETSQIRCSLRREDDGPLGQHSPGKGTGSGLGNYGRVFRAA